MIAAKELVGTKSREKHSCRRGIRYRGSGHAISARETLSSSREIQGTGYGEIHLGIVGIDKRRDLTLMAQVL